MTTATAEPLTGDMGDLTTKVRLRTKKHGNSFTRSLRRTRRKAWRVVRHAGVATKHGAKKTGRGALRVGQVVVGSVGVVLFRAVDIVVTVVTGALTLVGTGLIMLCAGLVLPLAMLSFGIDKYAVGSCKWMAMGPAKRERRGNSLSMYLTDRRGYFWDRAARSTLLSFLTGKDTVVEREVVISEGGEPNTTTEATNDRPRTNSERGITFEEVDVTGTDLEPSLQQFITVSEEDRLFHERVQGVIDNDADNPDERYPGVDVIIPFEPDESQQPIGYLLEETAAFEKYASGLVEPVDYRMQDFSQFDDNPELKQFYTYLRDLAMQGRDLSVYSYWEGRIQMLDAFMSNSDNLDKNGIVWALVHSHFRGHQDEYSIKYLRAGFRDEITALEKKRNRQQAATAPKPQQPKKAAAKKSASGDKLPTQRQ